MNITISKIRSYFYISSLHGSIQISHSCLVGTWSGIFTVQEIGSTQMGQGLTGQQELVIGKQLGKIGQCTLKRDHLG